MAGENGIYPYKPSQIACIIAAALFGISAAYHLFQMLQKRTWYYTCLVVGAISSSPILFAPTSNMLIDSVVMTAGYIARYFSSKTPTELMPYIMQSLFIILPPSLYAASIYMIYGSLALFVRAPDAFIIRPTRVTKIFVIGDVVAFFTQAGGGGMMAQADMADMGQKVMLIGLFVQLAFFGLFLIVSLVFWKRMRAPEMRASVPRCGKHGWHSLLLLLLAAADVIILRCVFRIIEFAQGHDGYLISHEVFLYIFDAAPMLLVQAMFHFIHAGDVFGRDYGMRKIADDASESGIPLHQHS